MTPEQTDLLISYIDNELTEAEVEAVEEQLKQDAELRGAFSMLLRQRVMLANIESKKKSSPQQDADQQPVTAKTVRRSKTQEPVTAKTVRRTKSTQGSTTRSHRRKKKKSIPFALYGSIAAALLVAIAWIVMSPPAETPDPIDETPTIIADLPKILQQSGSITWEDSRKTGDQLENGEKVILGEDGYLKLQYEDQSIVSFNANSELIAYNKKSLELNSGKLSANIRKQKDGGTVSIRTTMGEVRVIGTSFTVEVIEDKTITKVQEGIVEVDDIINGHVYKLQKDEECQVFHKEEGEVGRMVVGTVTAVDDGGEGANEHVELIIKTTYGESMEFKPVWHDGGFDEKMNRRLGQLKVGDQIRVHWFFEEHFRVAEFEKLN